MIKDFNFSLFDVLNKVQVDKFGRVSAFLAMNKPVGITSHDLVDQVRRVLKTRQVGHVGALDPFASGVMLILVGSRYTRMSVDLMELDKAYRTEVLFGLTTDSLDIEGKVIKQSDTSNFNIEKVKEKLQSFDGGYAQYVPIFSSVKISGNKLRVLARQSESFEIIDENDTKYVEFKALNGKIMKLEIPKRDVILKDIHFYGNKVVNLDDIGIKEKAGYEGSFPVVEVEFGCSKGTYVRQFAYDLAQRVGQVGMLISLIRTKLGPIKQEDCINIEDLKLPELG